MHPRLGTSRTWPGPARAQGVYARAVRCGPGPMRQILLLVLPFLTWLIQMLNSVCLGRDRQRRHREGYWLGSAGDCGALAVFFGTAMRGGLGRADRALLGGGARALMSGKITTWGGGSGRWHPG